MYQTPKRNKLGSKDDSGIKLTPDNRVLKSQSSNSADKGSTSGESRRGRPNADLLSTLILEGSTSPSSIKCKYCGRVFPREKSLQAHLRTHTGEKPYICDYPRCTRKFAQSGQLKTHQRLHTGEKPFVCAAPNCTRSFTHANRHCPDHPEYTLKRFNAKHEPNLNKKYDDAHNAEVKEWLNNWDRRNKSSSSNENLDTTPKKSIFKLNDSVYSSASSSYFSHCSKSSLLDDIENSPKSDLEYDISNFNSSNSDFDMQEASPKSTPSELPKKRWLREAVQNQTRWESTNDLASPINWGDEPCTETEKKEQCEKQNRPSVLVCVQGGKSKEISSEEIQGAMALVELKNSINYRV
ncbi:zinc finger protein 76-like [Diorhabda carinulata]|uniref:zinc finger protein 76-like n=1 Tax=Diorhabda carinulata TaxID=1163345 RepID=UPI00259FF976|nr:zinc finger protein 76-like [Diorhabda carinulata]